MSTLKSLRDREYSVTSFQAFQTQSYDIVSGSTDNPEQVSIDIAVQPPSDFLLTLATGSTVPGLQNDSGRFAYPLFSSVVQSFYTPSESVTLQTAYHPTSSCYVVSIGSNAFGEQIKPGTFSLQVSGSGDSATETGDGKLYVDSTQIGNIFYDAGVVVLDRNESASSSSLDTNGMMLLEDGSTTVTFNSTITIYEHTATCKLEPSDFNWTWNPSLLSGSSEAGDRVYSQFASGSLVPYVTTIGLYNELGEMMAVAKLSRPIPRTERSRQTFIVKFDT